MDEEAPIMPPALDKLAAALAAAQAEMPTVSKTHTASVRSDKGSYSYTYAGLADVTEAVLPILAKHGLSFTALPGGGMLTGMLLHTSGQSLTASLPIAGSTPQALGSSLTYMRRYLLGCMTGLVTDDDDDGQLAQASSARSKQSRPAPVAAAPVKTATVAQPPSARPATPEPVRDDSGSGGITKAQIAKIAAGLTDLGVTHRGQTTQEARAARLAYISRATGRTVSSSNELTSAEASGVIDSISFDLSHPVEPDGGDAA